MNINSIRITFWHSNIPCVFPYRRWELNLIMKLIFCRVVVVDNNVETRGDAWMGMEEWSWRECADFISKGRGTFLFFFSGNTWLFCSTVCLFFWINHYFFFFSFFRYIQEFFVRCVYNSSMYALLLELWNNKKEGRNLWFYNRSYFLIIIYLNERKIIHLNGFLTSLYS